VVTAGQNVAGNFKLNTMNSFESNSKRNDWRTSVLLTVVMLVISGCSMLQSKPTATLPPEVATPDVSRPDGSVRGNTNFEKVARLWAAAEEARINDQNNTALELLYEALEVNPQNALLWSRAAEIQLDTLEAALAESYATKSNAFAANNRPLLHRNWMIIEYARNMRGDLMGVRSASKKVKEYQYQ